MKANITSEQIDAVSTSYIWDRLHHKAKTKRPTFNPHIAELDRHPSALSFPFAADLRCTPSSADEGVLDRERPLVVDGPVANITAVGEKTA